MSTIHQSTGRLRAGAAKTVITPSDLTGLDAMTGGFTGVHDELRCRAVVIVDGGSPVAIVALDLLEVGSSNDLRARIEQQLGISGDNVLIAASHSHTAPRVGRTPDGGLSRPPTAESLAFTEHVFDAVIETIRLAQAAQQPATIGFGRGSVDVNVNRDELRDGEWMLGQNPDGPSDKTVRVISLTAADGDRIATLACYAVHPTVSLGTKLLGADLAGAAADSAEQQLGGVVLWLPGSIGDQTPRQSAEHDERGTLDIERAFGWVQSQGTALGNEIVRTTRGIDGTAPGGHIGGSQTVVSCAARRGSRLAADMSQDDVQNVGVRVTLLRLGDIALVGIGGEVTTPAAELILAALPIDNAVLVSIANERIGYLADEDAFTRGTFAARGCPVQPGWDHSVAEAAAGMLADKYDSAAR